MNARQIEADLLRFIRPAYPEIQIHVRVSPEVGDRLAIYFIEERFRVLYPEQRSHYLVQLIPADYREKHLANLVWCELAPGEQPVELRYPDEGLVESITPDVMACLQRMRFFEALDDILSPNDSGAPRAICHGDFRHSKSLLLARRFDEEEQFDIFHVLMAQGGYCDCEILYNVAKMSRLRTSYRQSRDGRPASLDRHPPA